MGIYNAWSFKLDKSKVLKLINSQFVETFGYVKCVHTDYPLGKLMHYLFYEHKYIDIKQVLTNHADAIIKSFEIEVPTTYFPVFDEMSKSEVIEFFKADKWPSIKVHIEVYDEAFLEQFDDFIPLVGPIEIRYLQEDVPTVPEPIVWEAYKDKV